MDQSEFDSYRQKYRDLGSRAAQILYSEFEQGMQDQPYRYPHPKMIQSGDFGYPQQAQSDRYFAEMRSGWVTLAIMFGLPIFMLLAAMLQMNFTFKQSQCNYLRSHPVERSLPQLLGWFDSEYKEYQKQVGKACS